MYQWIDRFIPELLQQKTEHLYRARAFVRYVLVYFTLCLTVLLVMLLSPERSAKALQMTASITIPLLMFFALLLMVLRYTSNIQLCSRLLLALSSLTCLLGILITGGAGQSPIEPVTFLPVLMAACIFKRREGVVWMVLVSLGYLGLYALETSGVISSWQLMEARHLRVNTVFAWAVTALCSWAIVATFAQLNQQLAAERDENNQRLEHLASTDELTGIANRRTFEWVLHNTLERHRRYKSRFALLYIDLDNFKPINDKYGHAVGDEILQQTAERLRASLREMDLVARIGGDEFAVIADSVVTTRCAAELQAKIQGFFSHPVPTSVGDVVVQASCGYSVYPDAAECVQSLRIGADKAMYSSKEERKRALAEST